MTAGMAFEAMNNAGVADDVTLLVILNDNDMSISPPVGALNRYLARLMSGRFYAAAREGVGDACCACAAGARTRPQARRAREGHDRAGHAVRGVRLQLHRADRRPRSRLADPDAAEHQGTARPAIPARRHEERPGLQARRSRSGAVPRPRQVRSGRRHQAVDGAGARRPTRRCSASGCATWPRRRIARGRHHAGDARRLGHGRVREALPGALLRCRHRRAARGDVRRRAWPRRHEAGRRDLFDLPAARLRPVDPRRRAAEPAGGVRDRSRGPGRRGRRDARGQLRPRVPALHPEHDGDGRVGRKRVPRRCCTRRCSNRTRRPCAIRAARAPASKIGQADDAIPSARARCAANRRRSAVGQAHRDPRVRHHGRPRACGRAKNWTRPSPTCVS